MKGKINSRLIIIAIIAVISTLVGVTCVYYGLFQRQVKNDLRTEAQLLIDMGTFSGSVAEILGINLEGLGDLRITWIDADGTVLYDNEADVAEMENHANRPEVKQAMEDGVSEVVRQSDTMHMNTFYHAVLLDNGTVLRVSTKARTIFSVFLAVCPLIFLITAIIVVLCIVIAHFLTRQLLRPINVMAENLDDMSKTPQYKELAPFAEKIRAQHENVLMASKARQDFTANVSHELKTPLTAISGYAELIENHMVEPEQETHFARQIQQNANRLLTLINDIIRLSELDNGKKGRDAIEYEEIDLDMVARSRMEELEVSAAGRGVSISYEGVPCKIRANRGMIAELIDNLCENSIRYNNEGGHVWVKVAEENGRASLTVKDDGIGIPKDQQDRVFERFYRVDKSRSKETGGTGLGLAIVKHIVELHGATISLKSEPCSGTEMRVEF